MTNSPDQPKQPMTANRTDSEPNTLGNVSRGYCAIGMWEPKTEDNFGGILRSAHAFGADFVFTIGNRYHKQPTDTSAATRHIPFFHYTDMQDFYDHLPQGSELVGIELTDQSKPIESYHHPERAVYLLGGEDRTLPGEVLSKCMSVRKINTAYCLNVASAATVVLYDRRLKG